MSHQVTNTDWSGDDTQTGCLQEVHTYKWSEHVQRRHAPSDHTACAGWADVTLMLQNSTKHLTTVSHGCARSLRKPCSTISNRSIHVFLSQTFAASKSRITLSVGLVPIVPIPQALLACSYQHHHRCRIPILRRFHHSRYFAVCNAFVNPSAGVYPGSRRSEVTVL